MSRFGPVALALGLLATAPALRSGTPGGPELPSRKESWRRVDTLNFSLYGNATESKIREVGLDLERLRSVLSLLTPSLRLSAPVPTTVYVFKSDSAMKAYKPRYAGKPGNVSGFFLPGTDGNYIVLAAGWNEDPRRILYHEYSHFFMRNNFPPQAPWFEEGLAEFYSTFQSTAREARVGRPVEEHVWLLRSTGLMPLQKLFAVDMDSPEYHESSRQGVFYAQSWALVHFLMTGEPKRKEGLWKFLTAMQKGKSSEDAFRESFSVDHDKLLTDLDAYIRRGVFPNTLTTFLELKAPEETKPERMAYTEVLCRLGELLARGPEDRLSDAEAHFLGALAESPENAGALAGMGFVRMRREKYSEADEFYRKAIASGSADFRTYFHHGRALLYMLSRQPMSVGLDAKQREAVEEARAAFRESLARNGDFAEARAELGRTYLFEDSGKLGEGITALEVAVRALPSRRDLALDLATLYEKRGETEKSDRIRGSVLGAEAASKLAKARKKEGAFQEGLDRVNALLAAGREDEAITLFEELLATAPEDVRAAFQDQRMALRRGAARKQDFHGALAAFREVAANREAPELVGQARIEIERIERWLSSKRPKLGGTKGN